ncbi:outer membrane beta-barrel protein [Agaribacterium haliotis]|uniref:outer membrane beta-barrel protein n=1 Tax=Agaribacterium haliotis TaxID=2013869 RepID=UPI0013040D01|nr:outer membrane beta-barrel protein [Agaribacterium haliotis]
MLFKALATASKALGAALIVLPLSANADFYIDGDLGYATPEADEIRASSGPGYSVGIGSELTSWLALELDYVGLGNFSVTGADVLPDDALNVIGIGVASDFTITGFSASMLLSWRPNRWDNFYARAGYFAWSNEIEYRVRRGAIDIDESTSIDGQDPMFGLGYAYLLGGSMESSIEYNRYYAGDVSVDIIAVGLNYHF